MGLDSARPSCALVWQGMHMAGWVHGLGRSCMHAAGACMGLQVQPPRSSRRSVTQGGMSRQKPAQLGLKLKTREQRGINIIKRP